MPPRKTTASDNSGSDNPVTDPGPEHEPESVDKATIVGWIKEVIADIGITNEPDAEPVEGTNEVEELESPRMQEARMRREVERAVNDIHIHLDQTPAAKEEPKKEPEVSPGKPSRLAKLIGMS